MCLVGGGKALKGSLDPMSLNRKMWGFDARRGARKRTYYPLPHNIPRNLTPAGLRDDSLLAQTLMGLPHPGPRSGGDR